jgi:uncharacterized MAPEG superfamily protein
MANSDDLYARANWLEAQFREHGMASAADRLAALLHGMAWTTSSELIGELGSAFLAIRAEYHGLLSAEILKELDAAIASARKVWPDLT